MASGLENTATGTLKGADVKTRAQALREQIAAAQQQQLDEAAAASQKAQQEAQQAQSAFQSAAEAPPPQLDPLAVSLPTLMSGIASVLTQDPSFRENAQKNIQLQQRDLMKRRADNLAQLRDAFAFKAEEASKAGALEDELKFRNQFETLSKKVEDLRDRSGDGRQMSADEILANMDPEKFKILLDRTSQLEGTKKSTSTGPQSQRIDEVGKLLNSYITAGQAPPPSLIKAAESVGLLQPGTLPTDLPGARKPFASEIAALKRNGVPVVNTNQYLTRKAAFEGGLRNKKDDVRKDAQQRVKNFMLSTRIEDEPLNIFIARMRGEVDRDGNRIFSDEEINEARKRLYPRVKKSPGAPVTVPTTTVNATRQLDTDPLGVR